MTTFSEEAAMGQPAKFTFDTEFIADADGTAPMPRSYSDDDLDAFRVEGHAAGYAAGQNDALVKAEQETGAVLRTLADACTSILSTLDSEQDRLTREAGELAVLMASKLAPTLLDQQPTAEIEALVEEVLSHMSHTPQVVVRVNPSWQDRIEPKLMAIAAERGFDGKLIVVAKPDTPIADCQIEWAGGGLVRDSRALCSQIEQIVERRFGARMSGFVSAGSQDQ